MTLRVAACAYPIEAPTSFEVFAEKQARWVEAAATQGAQLLVFPEYASVELTAALPQTARGELTRELHALQDSLEALNRCYATLASQHTVHILAPSFPERDTASGLFHNRARLHAPSGSSGVTDKLQMTRFEAEQWGISPGQTQVVFQTELGALGVAICYDSEFPLIVRRQVELGAEVILVPSCTDSLAGFHRVALSCRARALENQCYVVHSTTVGAMPESLALDQNHGAAGVYGPIDRGFTDDGVIARGAFDVPGWVMADLNLAALPQVREVGQVRNQRDWANPGHLTSQPIRVQLS
jgi:predicted amidohydrolase